MSNFCPTMIYMATGEIKKIQQVEHFEDDNNEDDDMFEDFDEGCKVCEQNLKEQKYKLMKYKEEQNEKYIQLKQNIDNTFEKVLRMKNGNYFPRKKCKHNKDNDMKPKQAMVRDESKSPKPTKSGPSRSPKPTNSSPSRSPKPTQSSPSRSPKPTKSSPSRSPKPTKSGPSRSPKPTNSANPSRSPKPTKSSPSSSPKPSISSKSNKVRSKDEYGVFFQYK